MRCPVSLTAAVPLRPCRRPHRRGWARKFREASLRGCLSLQALPDLGLPAAETLDGSRLQPQQRIRQMGLVAGQVLFDDKAHQGKPLVHALDVGGSGGGAVFQQRLRHDAIWASGRVSSRRRKNSQSSKPDRMVSS